MAGIVQGGGFGVTCAASGLLHGCVRLTSEGAGWVRPWRLTDAQMRSVGSCGAWHPGLLRQMGHTTAGISLEFETDATEVRLGVRLDEEPPGTRAVLERMVPPVEIDTVDALSADIDGRHLSGLLPVEGTLTIALEDLSANGGQAVLPGFGQTHHVRIWLPALRGCLLRDVRGDGSFIEPVAERAHLLVLGDSIAQGFTTGDPALSWPARLAEGLGIDLVNQGLGGQVFQPGTLRALSAVVTPELIVVELGENYRFEPCRERVVAHDIRSYLAEVAHSWPHVATYVCTPTWHDETRSFSHALSCWKRVPELIAEVVPGHAQMRLVEGDTLMDHDHACLADLDGHPNARGAAQIAERLHAYIVEGSQEDTPA